jgi:uncharacterized membrane protein
MDAYHVADSLSGVVELVGIAVLGGGVLFSLVHSTAQFAASRRGDQAFRTLRSDLGNSILLGLEFLVAADIIRSISIALTFQSVGVLGLIVLVRTFLSWSLQVEVSGAWPWQRPRSAERRGGPGEHE